VRWAILRLFNVAGAASEAGIGEDRSVETHLIPLAIRAALGTGPPLRLFGESYSTPDATPLRDYVHVADVANAVRQAIEYLHAGGRRHIFNVGSGIGSSVREVIKAVERASGRAVPVVVDAPRPGDPATLVADTALAQRHLGFRPLRSELNRIVADALSWETSRASS
jgi:UDP-arabinose 4-epimerase